MVLSLVGEAALCEQRSQFLDSPQKIDTNIKTARRKVASTKQFTKDSMLSRKENRQVQRWPPSLRLQMGPFFLCAWRGGHVLVTDRMVSKGSCFQSFGASSHWLGVGVSDPTRFVPEPSWLPFPYGVGRGEPQC